MRIAAQSPGLLGPPAAMVLPAFFYTYQNRRYRQFEQEGDSA